MPVSINRPVFVHDFLNPPTEDRSCNIDITIMDSTGAFELKKEAPGLQTRFNLTIANSSIIGLVSSEQSAIEIAIKDLVLAINLALTRTCMSTLGNDLFQAEVKSIPTPTKVTIEEGSKGKNISIVETIFLRDTVHISIGTREDLSEQKILAYLNQIPKAKRFSPNPTLLRELNTGKALKEYENAMSTFDRLRIFKSLFNSLVLCQLDGLELYWCRS